MPGPSASVVISTYNRPRRLAALLAGLRRQTLSPDSFEVIVVDNGSGPQTGAQLGREQDSGGLQLRILRHERTLGPAGGRNAGWRASSAALVAFIDDDCVPRADWLERGLEVAQSSTGAIVQGRTVPDPAEQSKEGIFSRSVRVERLGPWYETCNIFYPRTVLKRLGGFDESFGLKPAGEDTDLAWRALGAGIPSVFAQDAVVEHAVDRLGPLGMLRVAARWSAAVRVFAEHPGPREMLYRGVFWDLYHYLMWRSLLALLTPAWLRRMLIARHLLELRLKARAEGAGSWAVPFLIVHDAVECWAVARGAIRYRTLVL